LDFDPKEFVLTSRAHDLCAKFIKIRTKTVTVGVTTDRETDVSDYVSMLHYSNGTDKQI